MDIWMAQFKKLITVTLGNPVGTVEPAVLVVLGALLFIGIMSKLGDMFRVPLSTSGRSSLLLVINVLVILVVVAALNIYVTPRIGNPMVARALPIAAIILIVVAVTAPLMILIQKAPYTKAITITLLSIVGAVAAILLAGSAFDAFRSGKARGFDKAKDRTDEMNDFLSK